MVLVTAPLGGAQQLAGRPKKSADPTEATRRGRVIRELRDARGISQLRLAGELGMTDQSYISRLERGVVDPAEVGVARFRSIARGLGVTIGQLAEEMGIEPKPIRDRTFLETRGDLFHPTIEVPVFRTVAGGIKGFEHATEPDEFQKFDLRTLPKGVNPDAFYIVRVNGDSMYSDDLQRPVPSESWLLVEAGAAPADGNVVVAFIPGLDIGVVKQYRRNSDGTCFLRSYKPGGPSFYGSSHPEMTIEGIVRKVIYDP